jgi:hypothetical protein
MAAVASRKRVLGTGSLKDSIAAENTFPSKDAIERNPVLQSKQLNGSMSPWK